MDVFDLKYFSPWLKGNIDDWRNLIDYGTITVFKKNSVIFYMGDVNNYAYILKDGRVGLNTYSEDGDEITIAIIESGAMFGELSLLDNEPNICTAIAIRDTEVYRISKPDLISVLSTDPQLHMAIMNNLCQKIRLLHSHLLNISSKSATSRVALKFLQMCEEYGIRTNNIYKLRIKFTHQELANITGLNRVSVSNIIRKFTNKGIITKNNNYFIIEDLEKLKVISEQGTLDDV